MPKPVQKLPDSLRPFNFHGVDFVTNDGKEATADCPWCGREEKFSVNVESSKWQCFVCGEEGNHFTFVRKLWEESTDHTTYFDYAKLARDRRIARPETLLEWRVCKSSLTDDWLVPGYNPQGGMDNLYRYFQTSEGPKLLPTPVVGVKLFGMNFFDKSCTTIYLQEGPWDPMALWEVLGSSYENGDQLLITSNRERSMLNGSSVLGVPGCNTFKPEWSSLFSGKEVFLMFDNDYPRQHPKTGNRITPAAYGGMERIAKILSNAEEPPESISFLAWGGLSGDYDPSLPKGFDVREALTTDLLN